MKKIVNYNITLLLLSIILTLIPTVSSVTHVRFGSKYGKQSRIFIDRHFALQVHELCFSRLTVKYGDSVSNGGGGGGELVRVDK